MSGIILYQSKYGATKRYVDWLLEETGFDCIETKKAKIEAIKQYSTIYEHGRQKSLQDVAESCNEKGSPGV